MVKLDPYKHKEQYLRWREKTAKNDISGLSKANSSMLLQYLKDMEQGINLAMGSKKGARSYIRLNILKQRLIHLFKMFEKRLSVEDVTKIEERQVCGFFSDMRNGAITKLDGGQYKSVRDYAKNFKSFWHWHQRVLRKQGKEIMDITYDVDTSCDKPDWVYLTEEQVKAIANEANYKYRVLIWFLFDTGIRAPTELANIKVSDLYNDCKELNIREEISKTFGRRIKLMLCSELLRDYIKKTGRTSQDYLFKISPGSINRTLRRLGKNVLGDKASPAGQKYSDLTMYDFRHCSCCYWLPRYKSESALKYRFGWKKSDKVHYYSELLGMKDTISQDDLLIDQTKTQIEQKLEKTEKEKDLLMEKLKVMELQMMKITELTEKLGL